MLRSPEHDRLAQRRFDYYCELYGRADNVCDGLLVSVVFVEAAVKYVLTV